jgi:hypothetical protein
MFSSHTFSVEAQEQRLFIQRFDGVHIDDHRCTRLFSCEPLSGV